jgi:hypothetical protein
MHSAPSASHVIFLQDDVRVAAGFLPQLHALLGGRSNSNDTAQHANSTGNNSSSIDVLALFSSGGKSDGRPYKLPNLGENHFGLVAVVFRAAHLPGLIAHLRASFAAAPVDWLVNGYITQAELSVWVYLPNLVQHVGRLSSLAGKVQPIVSGSFVNTQC